MVNNPRARPQRVNDSAPAKRTGEVKQRCYIEDSQRGGFWAA